MESNMGSSRGLETEFYQKYSMSRHASVNVTGSKSLKEVMGATAQIKDVIYVARAPGNAEAAYETEVEEPGSPHRVTQEKRKLVIILVGLPGRGKTYLCNKLMCYLNWLGHKCKHFNVGAYRRKIRTTLEENEEVDAVQDAAFFDPTNEAGMKSRQQALESALDDLKAWLHAGHDNQVAIFDATNSTEKRRNYLRDVFRNVFQYMFIESICNDMETLEKNYRLKMLYSPDYQGVDTTAALNDFRERILQYEKVYEPLTDGTSNRDLHFIQLNNMVTGRGHMDINRISGYIPGKIVFFLMQICTPGLTADRKIWLSRHGESEYNRNGKIGGDAPLTELGARYADRLPDALIPLLAPLQEESYVPVSVWTSTLKRTVQTNKLPFPHLRWKALDEIHAGICDGMTYPEIQERMPDVFEARKHDKLRYRYPSGESYLDVISRLEPVIIECERERESIVIIAHQAILRVLYGYFMKVDIEKIPELSMPLHTLIELSPRPDGTMVEQRFAVDISENFHANPSMTDLFTNISDATGYDSPGSARSLHYPAEGGPSSPVGNLSLSEHAPLSAYLHPGMPTAPHLSVQTGAVTPKKKKTARMAPDVMEGSTPTKTLAGQSSCASSSTLVRLAQQESVLAAENAEQAKQTMAKLSI